MLRFRHWKVVTPDPRLSISIVMVLDVSSIPLQDFPSPVGSSHSSERVILGGLNSPPCNPSNNSVAQGMGRGSDDAEYGSERAKNDNSGGIPEELLSGMEENEIVWPKPSTSQIGGPLVECFGSSSVGTADRDIIQQQGSQTSSMKPTNIEQGSILELERNSYAQDRGKYKESDQNSPKSDPGETPIAPSHPVSSLHSSVVEQSLTELDPQPPELFHAFPEKGWFRAIPLAVGGFLIMTLLVLGNLIYTYQSFVSYANL